MIKYILCIALICVSAVVQAQTYRTQAISPEINTILVNLNDDWRLRPVMRLNSSDNIQIRFDRISDNSFNRLRYKIIHCDSNWKPSKNISEIDYLDGFNDNPIEDFLPSINTTVEYTHFMLKIPNRDINVRISGNYTLCVYEENKPDNILLTACFSVLDPRVTIGATISTNTNIDSHKEHQQLSFTINHPGVNIREPLSELKVFAIQNNRIDNEVKVASPTFIGVNKLTYEQNRDLIFEAGNEYRRFETSSYRFNGMNVDHIEYNRPFYSMNIVTDKVRAGRSYSYDEDQNGRFVIRSHDARDVNTESDYFITNFTLTMNDPLLENIFINGDFTNDTFSEKYKMKYDHNKRAYTLSLLLKQGNYNYQYLSQLGNKYSTSKVEGNYFETENEYTILVYYCPIGQRYDALIGFQNINTHRR